MADMNEIFGSDSDTESEKKNDESEEVNEEEHQDQSNDEQNEEQNDEGEQENEGEEEQEQHENENEENDEDDDEEIVRKKKVPKTSDVFGDELADLSPDESEKSHEADEENQLTPTQEESQEEEEPEQIINIEIPRVKTDLGKEIHFVKLPNFLSVEPKPFNPETYEDENPQGDTLDEEGKTRVRLKVENTIRWRYEKDELGDLVKQSNARFVKWSDGSLSMYLGNEIFDVYKAATQGDHNHLFIRQGNVLHGQTVFRTKLTFRPHSIDSMTHRKMTLSLVEHGSKTKKVKILTEIAKNPEFKRQELLKKEEEKLKAASRRQNQQRRMREKSHSKGISADYLEDKYESDDEESGAISLSAIKNKFKPGHRNDSKTSIYSSSDEDESDREHRLNRAKQLNDDSDEDDDDDYESERKSHGASTSSSKKKKTKKVMSDDEDE